MAVGFGIQSGANLGGAAYTGPGASGSPPGSTVAPGGPGGGGSGTAAPSNAPFYTVTDATSYLPDSVVFPGVFIAGTSAPLDTRFGWRDTSTTPSVFYAYDPNESSWVQINGSGTPLTLPQIVIGAVKAVSVSNISSLSGIQSIDGASLGAGDVCLLTNQATTSQNGPWVQASGSWTRPTWYADALIISPGFAVLCYSGNTHSGNIWVCTNSSAVTVDTTGTNWLSTSNSVGALMAVNNLSDVTSVGEALTNLGLTSPINYQGAWSSTQAYNINDLVTDSGNIYICSAANTNEVPTATTGYWTQLNSTGSGGGSSVTISTSTPNAETIGATGSAGSTGQVSDAGHVHPLLSPSAATIAAYVSSYFDAAGSASGLLTSATPTGETVGASGATGSSTTAARADHTHAMPGTVTESAAGFMSATDKTKLDGITTATSSSLGLVQPDNSTIIISDGVLSATAVSPTNIWGGVSSGSTTPPAIISASATRVIIGQTITLTGVGFSNVTAVTVGGVSATFSISSSTSMTVTIPTGTTGSIVLYAGTYGTYVGLALSIANPTISGYSENPAYFYDTITITGTAFTGATAVIFNGGSALSYTVVSDTTITAIVPPSATNGVVTLITPYGSCVGPTLNIYNTPGTPHIVLYANETHEELNNSLGYGTSGYPRDYLIILGSNMWGTTSVQFGSGASMFPSGTSSTAVIVNSIPSGALSGPIYLTNSYGTGTGPYFTVL